jgi:hypothetical protein
MPKTLRNVRRYRQAEKACQAFRAVISTPVAEATREQWNLAMDHLTRWISLAGKAAYQKPRPIRKPRRKS